MTIGETPLDLALPVGDADHVRGAADAVTTLLVYGDFQCPYCALAARRMPAVLATGRVRLVFRHFPVSEVHGRAEATAVAAEAAGLQGRFWEMHDRLFAGQDRAGDNDLVDHARVLGLDLDRFRAALADDGVLGRVRADRAGGERAGAHGTPTFFVDGRRCDGPWWPLLTRLTQHHA